MALPPTPIPTWAVRAAARCSGSSRRRRTASSKRNDWREVGLGALSSLPAAHLDLFGQPEPDQGIAGHVALVGRERDAPAAPGQAQRPRGRRRLEVGQPHLPGPTPLHEVAVVVCPRNACSSVMTGLMGGDPGISTSSASAVPPAAADPPTVVVANAMLAEAGYRGGSPQPAGGACATLRNADPAAATTCATAGTLAR